MTRTAKTPKQRAEEALAREERRVKRLTAKSDELRTELDAATAEMADAVTRRDYLAKHPDLAPSTPTTTRTTIEETTKP